MSKSQKVRIRPQFRGDQKDVVVYSVEHADQTAVFAMQLLEKWGLVAAIPDGEDSAGRAKLRLPTVNEIVTRAFDIAEVSMSEARMRDLMVNVPDLNEINKESDDAEAAKEAAREAKHLSKNDL